MTGQQKQELKRLLTAPGPAMAKAPRSVEFGAVQTLTKLVQVLAQIALQEADARPPIEPAHVLQTGLGVVKHYRGPGIKP